jgi:hypothetical protein
MGHHPLFSPFMDTKAALLTEIEAYLARTGMTAGTFGRRAVNDGKFLRRIRGGGGITTETADRVKRFMADNPTPYPAGLSPSQRRADARADAQPERAAIAGCV